MKLIRFLRDTKRPAHGTIIQTPDDHPNIIRCDNHRLFRKGEKAKVPRQYLAGLTEGEDFEFTDSN